MASWIMYGIEYLKWSQTNFIPFFYQSIAVNPPLSIFKGNSIIVGNSFCSAFNPFELSKLFYYKKEKIIYLSSHVLNRMMNFCDDDHWSSKGFFYFMKILIYVGKCLFVCHKFLCFYFRILIYLKELELTFDHLQIWF